MTTTQLTEELLLYKIASGKWDIQDARKRLHRDDFIEPSHRELFDSLIAISNRGEAISPDSLIRELLDRESLEAFGSAEAIKDLIIISEGIDIEEELSFLKNKSALRKIIEYSNGKDPREAIENIKRTLERHSPPKASKQELRFISEISKDYFKTKPPEKQALLHLVENDGKKVPFLHKGIVGMLVAEGGRGKTHLLSSLAASIATGIPWIGKFGINEPGAVCLILGENDPDDLHRLLWKTREHLAKMLKENAPKKDHERFMLHFENPLVQLDANLCPVSVHGQDASFIDAKGSRTSFYQDLLRKLKAKEPENGWQLIVLDPASRFAGPEAEKDNAIATAFVASLENIVSELKGRPTLILSHHKSKSAIREGGGQSDARGSSGLTDGVRWQANLTKDADNEGSSLFEITKTNFTPQFKKFRIKKQFDGVQLFVDWADSNVK